MDGVSAMLRILTRSEAPQSITCLNFICNARWKVNFSINQRQSLVLPLLTIFRCPFDNQCDIQDFVLWFVVPEKKRSDRPLVLFQ